MSDEAFLGELTSALPRENLNALSNLLGFRPTKPGWLLLSLVHGSFAGEKGNRPAQNILFSVNGKLQGLGSSLIVLALHDYAYFQLEMRNPKQAADFTSEMKSSIIVAVSDALGLPSNALTGPSISGEVALDAAVRVVAIQVVAGLYLSEGYARVLTLIHSVVPKVQQQLASTKSQVDFKSLLQEYAHSIRSDAPQYTLLEERGPQHEKEFHVRVTIKSNLSADGVGRSKKDADRAAAEEWFRRYAPQALTSRAQYAVTEPSGTLSLNRFPLQWQAELRKLATLLGIPATKVHLLTPALTHSSYLDLPPVLRQTVKAQNPLNGELSHGIVS